MKSIFFFKKHNRVNYQINFRFEYDHCGPANNKNTKLIEFHLKKNFAGIFKNAFFKK